MNKKKATFLSLVILVGVGYAIFSYFNHQSAINTVLDWSRLAPFPEEATEFKIKAEGSMFSRAFRASFRANSDVIQQWLDASPGIQDAVIKIDDEKIKKYEIKPGGGAQHAEVIIDIKKNLIKIYTYWS